MDQAETHDPQTLEADIKRSVIIACTLRSGSNLLCEWLKNRGYGRPTEFFQVERYQNVDSRRQGPASELATLSELRRQFQALHEGTRWRGAKWSWPQFRTFYQALEEAGDNLDNWLPTASWIFLTRRDLAAQAVSLFLAQHDGVWVSGDQGRIAEEIQYDFSIIWEHFRTLAIEQTLWSAFFAENDIRHLPIAYEDLIDGSAFARIQHALGDRPLAAGVEGELTDRNRALANPLAKKFLDKFRADLRAGRSSDAQVGQAVETLLKEMRSRQHSSMISRFINTEGAFPTVIKINLQQVARISGPHAWIDSEQFLDGYALRLDPGSVLELDVRAKRLMIELMAHSWSGACRITVGSTEEIVDLYHWHSVGRTWTFESERTSLLRVKLEPTGEKRPISLAAEVWLQQIWTLST